MTFWSANASYEDKARALGPMLMEDLAIGPDDACAIIGNGAHESGLFETLQEIQPTVAGSRGGYGWFQWTGPRRVEFENWCADRRLELHSHEANYGFLVYELTGTWEKKAIPAIKAKHTLAEKTIEFERQYERAGVKHHERRIDLANRARRALGSSTTPESEMSNSDAAFESWFKTEFPDAKWFKAQEFLVKGADHSNPKARGYRLNTNPPRQLWNNGRELIELLEWFRGYLGMPIKLHSVYRSPDYNSAIGGASGSQHKQFTAADFSVVGRGRPADWAATLRFLRSKGVFAGGVGEYKTFVHVDVGPTRDWSGSGIRSGTGQVLAEAVPANTQNRKDPATLPSVNTEEPERQTNTGLNATTTAGAAIGASTVVTAGSTPVLLIVGVVVIAIAIVVNVVIRRKRASQPQP